MERDDKFELVEPYNPTDPVVKFDPELDKSYIVVPYANTETNDESGPFKKEFGAQTRHDAIMVPLVQINQMKLGDDQIETVEISISKFFPELYLKIYDYNNSLSKLNSPGMTSIVTVIMAAPIEGVSKKISIDFYIIDSTTNPDGTIEIFGEMSIPSLNQVKNEQIGNDKMSTYDFLKQIAQDTKLGFAATEKCEEINDARWRQIYSKTFKDYINEQLSFAGLDNDSVFDAWVDQFGYLVMVNMSYVMSEEIDSNQLMMRVVKGSNFTEKKDMVEEQEYEEVLRMITNARDIPGDNNAQFSRLSEELQNDLIKDEGTANKYYYMKSIGDENTICQEEMEINEPSVDGKKNKDTYKFDKCEFIGFEMDEDSPILVQKKIVSRMKAMMNYKQIFVEMEKPNYYLQRGTLLNVNFEDYDAETKKTTIMNNANVTVSEDETTTISNVSDILEDDPGIDNNEMSEVKDALMNEQTSFTNYALSGIYYINDIIYKYDKGNNRIIQCMHLVKRGSRTNLINDGTNLSQLT